MAKEILKKEKVYFSTGHTLLDLIVGGGEDIGYGLGYPAGVICRDWGGSSSTKTFKACELVAANYHKFKDKFRWKYVDVEHGNTIDTMRLYGFDMFPPQKKETREVLTVEDWEYDVNKFLDNLEDDERGIYVLDSLDSLSSKEMEDRKAERHNAFDKDKEFKDGTFGGASAKFLSQEMFRGLSAKLEKKNSILYIISQERDNLNAGMYAKKNRLGGGRAIGFYETVRIYSKLKTKEEQKGRTTGVLINITAEKVRHPRPFRDCFVSIMFDYGMDSLGDELDFLLDLRSPDTGELLKRSKSIEWFETGMEEMDRADLIKYIEANGKRDELKRRCIEKWENIEKSIASQRSPKYGA